MKKALIYSLILSLLITVLFGCSKANSLLSNDKEELSVVEDIKKSDPEPEVTPDPDPEPEKNKEDIFQKLRLSEEGKSFYNAEKEPWGINDFKIYDYKGNVVKTAKSIEEDEEPYLHGAGLGENEVTYRGIAIGDDAYEALLHMKLPKEAILPRGNDYVTYCLEYAIPFDIEKISEEELKYCEIEIYFCEKFYPVDVIDVFPATEKVGAVWGVLIEVRDNKIYRYGSSYLVYRPTNNI